MARYITSGTFPTGLGGLTFHERNITTQSSPANVSFYDDGLELGDPAGNIAVVTTTEFTDNNELRFADAAGEYQGFKAPASVDTSVTYTLPSSDGARAGQALTTDAAGTLSWQYHAYTYSIEVASFNAELWKAYFVDTTSAPIIATLPSSPALGDTIRFFDVAGNFDTATLTIARNGSLIMGDAADMTVTTVNAAFELVFSNTTYGWRIITV